MITAGSRRLVEVLCAIETGLGGGDRFPDPNERFQSSSGEIVPAQRLKRKDSHAPFAGEGNSHPSTPFTTLTVIYREMARATDSATRTTNRLFQDRLSAEEPAYRPAATG